MNTFSNHADVFMLGSGQTLFHIVPTCVEFFQHTQQALDVLCQPDP